MKRLPHLFWLIIFIELVVIVLVAVFMVVIKKQRVHNQAIVFSPIKKEYLLFPEDSKLQHYYESTTSAIIHVHQDWLPKDVTYTLNEEGLNERYAYSHQKPANTYRILTLGDSFTFGDNVNTKDNWPEQLEDALNTAPCNQNMRFEVINLGLSGYDMQYELERFIRQGVQYQPDFVIWFLNGDRWNELMYEKRLEKLNQMTEADRVKAREAGDFYPEWTYAANYVNDHFSGRQKLEQYRFFMQKFTQVYSGNLLVMTLSNVADAYKARLKSIVNERGMNSWYFDSLPLLQKDHTQLADGHPNELWYKETATTLATYLLQGKDICRIK